MGVSVRPDCGDFSYSGFGIWRAAVAEAAGWPVEFNERFEGKRHVVVAEKYHPRVFQGWWDDPPADPLEVLLVHSDCDGYLFPEHLEGIAKRLEEIAPQVEDGWNREATYTFARGLRAASERWQVVVFS